MIEQVRKRQEPYTLGDPGLPVQGTCRPSLTKAVGDRYANPLEAEAVGTGGSWFFSDQDRPRPEDGIDGC